MSKRKRKDSDGFDTTTRIMSFTDYDPFAGIDFEQISVKRKGAGKEEGKSEPSVEHSSGHSSGHASGHSSGHSSGLSSGLSNGLSSGPSTGHAIGHASGHSIGHASEHSSGHSKSRKPKKNVLQIHAEQEQNELSSGHENSPYPLTDNQYLILKYLFKHPTKILYYREIGEKIKIPYGSVRHVIKKLASIGFISEPNIYRKGSFQGFSYQVLAENFIRESLAAYSRRQNEQASGHSSEQADEQASGHSKSESKKKESKNVKIAGPENCPSSDDDFSTCINHHQTREALREQFPVLYECGFWSEQYAQVVEAWVKKKWDPALIPGELEKAEWHLANGAAGIENKCGYVLSALKRGPYSAPPGFKSKAQLMEEERAAEALRLREIRMKALEDHFDGWWLGLSLEDKKNIDHKITSEMNPIHGSLKGENLKRRNRVKWYRDNLFDPTK